MINTTVLPPVFLVAFSGHRPGDGPGRSREELEALRPDITKALTELRESAAAQDGSIEIYSSIASGADTIACEVAEELQLPIHLILPKPEHLFAEDFEGDPDGWQRAKKFIDAAHQGTRGSTIRVARGSHISPDCYAETNVQMLEGADVVIGIYNQEPTGKSGGTGQLLQQATALRLPIIQLNPATGQRQDSDLDRFANPDLINNGLQMMDSLRGNISASEAARAKTFSATRDALGTAADQSSKWFRRALVLAIVLHGVAAIVAGAAVSFQENIAHSFGKLGLPILAGIELLLVALALGFMLWHHHRGTQHTWLHSRFGTELLRSIEATSGILDPLHPQSKHYPPHWHRFALSSTLALLRESPPPTNFNELKSGYLKHRIDDQLGYFKSKLARATPLAHTFGSIASFSAWAAVLVVLGAFIYKLSHLSHAAPSGVELHTVSDQPTSALVGFFVFLLPIALPLLAGMASSLQTSLDVGRRKVRYREMVDNLESARHWIEQLETPVNLTLAASRVESVLLDEQIEWMAAAEAGQGH